MALAVSSRAFSGPSAALSRNRAQQQRARVARVRAPITLVAPRAYYGGCNPGGYGSSEQQARILREFMKQLQEQGSASFSWPGGRVWLGADWRDMGDMRSWDDDLASRMGATKDEAARQLEPWKLPVDLQQQVSLSAGRPGRVCSCMHACKHVGPDRPGTIQWHAQQRQLFGHAWIRSCHDTPRIVPAHCPLTCWRWRVCSWLCAWLIPPR